MANKAKLRTLINLLAELKRVVRRTEKGVAVLWCEEKGWGLQVSVMKGATGVVLGNVIMRQH